MQDTSLPGTITWTEQRGYLPPERMMSDQQDNGLPADQRGNNPDSAKDGTLSHIDDILQDNSEDFVRSFVERGGQGWSAFLDPQFYALAAAHGVISGATWAAFKSAMTRVLRSLHMVRAHLDLTTEGTLDPQLEQQLHIAWNRTRKLIQGESIEHSMDEATAFHWTVFAMELESELKTVKLRDDHYQIIARMTAATPESPTPSQLIARIIDEWLRENPEAGIGFPDT
ncbi:ubiquitin-like protein Pup [Streptomyces sp. NPDC059679]|uniref:ubiquitin-like protein Pup n=1 Tax=Streptomyces sp. NPDC059679 TaxID=3346903 RepID=UPI0036986F87